MGLVAGATEQAAHATEDVATPEKEKEKIKYLAKALGAATPTSVLEADGRLRPAVTFAGLGSDGGSVTIIIGAALSALPPAGEAPVKPCTCQLPGCAVKFDFTRRLRRWTAREGLPDPRYCPKHRAIRNTRVRAVKRWVRLWKLRRVLEQREAARSQAEPEATAEEAPAEDDADAEGAPDEFVERRWGRDDSGPWTEHEFLVHFGDGSEWVEAKRAPGELVSLAAPAAATAEACVLVTAPAAEDKGEWTPADEEPDEREEAPADADEEPGEREEAPADEDEKPVEREGAPPAEWEHEGARQPAEAYALRADAAATAHVDPEYAAHRARRAAEASDDEEDASDPGGEFAHLSNAEAVQALVATLSPDGDVRVLRPEQEIDERRVEALLDRLDGQVDPEFGQVDLGVPDPESLEWWVTVAEREGFPKFGVSPEARYCYGRLLAAIDHRPPAGTRSKKKRGKKPKK